MPSKRNSPKSPIRLSSKEAIEKRLRRDPIVHLYEIGDLDDFFWPHTTWFTDRADDSKGPIVLCYSGPTHSTVLGLTRSLDDRLAPLVESAGSSLPREFFAHFAVGVAPRLSARFAWESLGIHHRMEWRDRSQATDFLRVSANRGGPNVERLSRDDLPQILGLYERSYPNGWFDPRMLDTTKYFGIRRDGELVAIAGIHVYSREYGVAALGNITTDPAHRGHGLARLVTAHLCLDLAKDCEHVGLNVHSTNEPARRCYEKLGFAIACDYEELKVTRV